MTALLLASRAASYAGSWLLSGTLCFLVLIRGIEKPLLHAAQRRGMVTLTWIGWWVAFAAALLWLWAVAAEMAGVTLREAWDAEILSSVVLQSRFGSVFLARIGCLILLAMCLTVLFRRADPENRVGIPALLSLLSLGAVGLCGHSSSSESASVTLPADIAHLVFSGLWPGTLFPLVVYLGARGGTPDAALELAVRRFSNLGVASVSGLAVTGTLLACYMVRSFSALYETDYGRTLLIKLGLFSVLLLLAGYNLCRVRPRLADGKSAPALAVTVGLEAFLAVLMAVVVARLGVASPPH